MRYIAPLPKGTKWTDAKLIDVALMREAGYTYKKIGQAHSINTERARQMLTRAMKRLHLIDRHCVYLAGRLDLSDITTK